MDYVLDLYRMKVVSAINNDKKTHWKQFAILALLSNHAKLQELFLAFLTSLLSLDRYVKLFRAKLLREKKTKGLIRLPYFSSKTGGYNDVLMSILEETRPKMGDIALHNKGYSTVNEERQVVLDDAEDIHFKLQFAKVVTDKNDTPSILESNNVRDMNRSCGIVFSHSKTSEEIYKFLENKYFKREKSKQTLKSVPIMRVSKLDNKK